MAASLSNVTLFCAVCAKDAGATKHAAESRAVSESLNIHDLLAGRIAVRIPQGKLPARLSATGLPPKLRPGRDTPILNLQAGPTCSKIVSDLEFVMITQERIRAV